MIQAGDRVRVIDAYGRWHAATADSGIEGTRDDAGRKIHDFPVVWVLLHDYPDRMPWPQEAVDSDAANADSDSVTDIDGR